MKKNDIDDSVLINCSEKSYWHIVNFVIEDLVSPGPRISDLKYDERVFFQFIVLATSILGGCLWECAFLDLCRLTLSDVKPIVTGEQHEEGVGFWLYVPRGGNHYPVFMHPIVEIALLAVVICCLRREAKGNNGLRWPRDNNLLCTFPYNTEYKPSKDYSGYYKKTLHRYFSSISHKVLCQNIEFKNYIKTGRLLATYIYDLDVLQSTLGLLRAKQCLLAELCDPESLIRIKRG